MKMNLKAAVAAALLSVAPAMAFASSVTPPSAGPVPGTATATGSGLLVEAWDPTTSTAIIEWLGPDWTSFGPTGSYTPTASGGASYDFGTIGGADNTASTGNSWSSIFGASQTGNIQFVVLAANNLTTGAFSVETTGNYSATTVRNSSLNSILNTVAPAFSALNSSCSNANPCVAHLATDPADAFVTKVGSSLGNVFTSGTGAAGVAGGAGVGFWQLTQTSTTTTALASKTAYANATGAGTWTLSATGDLQYNIAGVSQVPLPAAAWLLVSGVMGLFGVRRRRSAA
jgi:hypothetical protein